MWQRRSGVDLSRFNGGKRTNECTKASGAIQYWLMDEVTRFGGGEG